MSVRASGLRAPLTMCRVLVLFLRMVLLGFLFLFIGVLRVRSVFLGLVRTLIDVLVNVAFFV